MRVLLLSIFLTTGCILPDFVSRDDSGRTPIEVGIEAGARNLPSVGALRDAFDEDGWGGVGNGLIGAAAMAVLAATAEVFRRRRKRGAVPGA